MKKYFTENLYSICLETPAIKYDKLSVLTGYSSSQFIAEFISKFPQIALDVFIGMAKQGISKLEHNRYIEITESNVNVNVYYQNKVPMTHIKLYQWYSNSRPTIAFVGSANFSENAFNTQNELLMETNESFENLLNEFKEKMIICTHEQVLLEIPIIDEEFLENVNNEEDDVQIKALNKALEENEPDIKVEKTHSLLELKRIVSEENLESLSIDLVDKNYISLNIWIQKHQSSEQSFLCNSSPKKEKQNFFPKNQSFKVTTVDNEEFTCYTSGNFGKNILVEENQGIDFYKYITQKMNINEIRELNINDFLNYGTIKVMFYKKNETEYYMDFSPK